MTFEDFKKLAERPRYSSENALFRVEVLSYPIDSTYPVIRLAKERVAFFLNIELAENYMRTAVREFCSQRNKIYGANIYQMPLGENTLCREADTIWAYDGNGELVSESFSEVPSDSNNLGCFRGRPANAIPFHRGDLVEIIDCEEAVLGIIIYEPPTISEAWEIYQRAWHSYAELGVTEERVEQMHVLDESDDAYCVLAITDADYQHHSVVGVSKPHLPIPDDMRQALLKRFKQITQSKSWTDK
jgi:hypothetical protein